MSDLHSLLVNYLAEELLDEEERNIPVKEVQHNEDKTYGIGKSYIRTVRRPAVMEAAEKLLQTMSKQEKESLQKRGSLRGQSAAVAVPRRVDEGALRALSPEQVTQFFRDGYLLLPDAFCEYVHLFKAEMSRLYAEGLFGNISKSDTRKALNLPQVTTKSRLFSSFVFSRAVRGLIADLIGSPFFLHLDQIFLKPARTGLGTAWHQDSAYYQIDNNLRGVSLWIAIDKATRESGTLELIPGSYKQTLPHAPDPEANLLLRCYPDEAASVPCELPPGGAVLFAYGMVHCTRNNSSANDRGSVAFHFFHSDYAKKDLLTQNTQYRVHVEGPLSTNGVSEYNESMEHVWDLEYAKRRA
ncbi:MAG: phytanoyl-CoA dioxygenase family protein [Deltaproteobacteria bacterium]|nr:phytanoyl-CoA dioxygenase family protein [Deltaproteobacteria bacterium]